MIGTYMHLHSLLESNIGNIPFYLNCNNMLNIKYSNTFSDITLSDDAVENIIKKCSENNVCIVLASGEPALFWDWVENFFIEKCNQYNAKYAILTNGFWGNDSEIIYNILSKIDNLFLNISEETINVISIDTIKNILYNSLDSKCNIYINSFVKSPAEICLFYLGDEFEHKLYYLINLKQYGFLTNDKDGHILFKNKEYSSLNDENLKYNINLAIKENPYDYNKIRNQIIEMKKLSNFTSSIIDDMNNNPNDIKNIITKNLNKMQAFLSHTYQ